MIGKHRDIAFARAQRRQGDDLETQPVEQVGAKTAGIGGGGQVFIGGGDDADIDPNGFRCADARDLPILHHTE